MDTDRLADDLPDLEARIKRAVRVLEDHLDAPAHGAEFLAAKPAQFPSIEGDRARRRPLQLQDATPGCRLAASGLADQAQRLAPPDFEIDAVHRLHMRDERGA